MDMIEVFANIVKEMPEKSWRRVSQVSADIRWTDEGRLVDTYTALIDGKDIISDQSLSHLIYLVKEVLKEGREEA